MRRLTPIRLVAALAVASLLQVADGALTVENLSVAQGERKPLQLGRLTLAD